MRVLVSGIVGVVALVGVALWMTADASTRGGPYNIYIFDRADPPDSHIYAFSVGQRSAAAQVEACDGQLIEDADSVVADFRARSRRETRAFNVIVVDGAGSTVRFGNCADPEDEEHDPGSEQHDTLVVVRGASEAQTRRLINEMDALSADERASMLSALGLSLR